MIQCILAWICAGLFLVLSRDPAPWLVRWRRAFVALGLALTAISVRFLWAQWHVVGHRVALDGELPHLLPRFLFVSGDLASSEAREFLARCRAPIVGKPFAAAELVERVREVALAATSVRSTAGDVDLCR